MYVSIVLLLICIYFLILKTQRPKNFPPGPFALPILGNLLNLNQANPLEDFERLRKTYGNVYTLFLGSNPAVVVNGIKAMKEAFVTKGKDFAGRPQHLFINSFFQHKGMITADYGLTWKAHRRFSMMTLKNFGMGGTSMEKRIHGEIQHMVKVLEDCDGKTMSFRTTFDYATANIICQVLFGRRYEYDDEFIKVMVELFNESARIVYGPWSRMYDAFPFIRNLPLPFQKGRQNTERILSLLGKLMTEHKKTRVPGEPRHFVDCYLDEMDKRVNNSVFSDEELIMTAYNLFIAGTDTSSNTLLFGFLHLATKQHIQERCQQEIDKVLEGKAQVSYEDRHKMPYVQAVIHEIQRMANILPLSVFHSTTKNTELMGYSLPKGTMVIQNMGSVLSEEGQWKFPHEFNPENFLNDKGELFKPESFIPFSAGPRVCPGEVLGRMELFLVVVTLLRKFTFSWPEDAGEPDLTPVFGITFTPVPYHMKVQLRSTKD
ncbi:unnamed protein product [Ophioblennius macclurei]